MSEVRAAAAQAVGPGAPIDDPDRARLLFDLAEKLFDSGRWAEASESYELRLGLGGSTEERWLARYRYGLCLLQLGETERGVGTLLEAFQERVARAEPLHALARHFRERGRSHSALMFALRGLEIPAPSKRALWVAEQLWEEVMISAYYGGPKYQKLGFDACERLLLGRGREPWFYDYVARNEVFYVPTLDGRRRGTFTVGRQLREVDGCSYLCTDPSVVSAGGRLFVNIGLALDRQALGYRLDGRYPAQRFRNVVVEWDPRSCRTFAEREVTASGRCDGLPTTRRMCWTVHHDRVLFAASREVSGQDGESRPLLGRMNEALDSIEELVPLECDADHGLLEDWVLWARRDGLYALCSLDPLKMVKIQVATGRTEPVVDRVPGFHAARWRAVVSPVEIPGSERRIGIVREVTELPGGRVCAHRWVELDETRGVVAHSRPFHFDHRGVERATGMIDLDGEALVVTYGYEEREARWVEVAWADVLAELGREPIDDG